MVSLGNMAGRLGAEIPELVPVLEGLEIEGSLRFGGGGCGSSCSSCASDCGGNAAPAKNEHTIVISLLMPQEDGEE